MGIENMTKKIKTPSVNIDGASISASLKGVVDYIKYRRYAKEGFTTVVEIGEENNTIRLRDGIITDGVLSVRGTEQTYLVNKVYMLPTKKLVTKAVILKADGAATLDLEIPYDSKKTKVLLNKFAQIKLLDEFNSFNMGQVILGLLAGIIVGAMGIMVLQMFGGLVVG